MGDDHYHLRAACSEAAAWKQWLDRYPSCILALSARKPDLSELDDFYTGDLPSLILSRMPSPFITKDELVKVVRWKLSRGTWSVSTVLSSICKFAPSIPELLDYSERGNAFDRIGFVVRKTVSKTSFLTLPDLEAAVSTLSSLKGVGPATASAVLAVAAPDVAPFMSDEALVAVLGGTKEYTLRKYLLFAEKLQSKAEELSRTGNLRLTPCDLERALWCSEVDKKIPTTIVTKKNSEEGSENSLQQKSNKRRKRK